MQRKRLAVLTARADDTVQRETLDGIASAALSLDCDVCVFSNIYNHWIADEVLNYENVIYDYFHAEHFDGVIICAEPFMDISVLDRAVEDIRNEKLPAVVIDGEIDGFIGTYPDDEEDMLALTEHLITVHGFTDIHILTGPADNAVSHRRAEGCRRAFETHGIVFDENKLFYGDFWTNSGEALAHRYLSGELPFPQAVVCTNDHMAYGLCDKLTEAGISIPKDVTVTGFDYTGERIYHYPMLTTCHRTRRKTGAQAVNILLNGNYRFGKQEGIVIGDTCPCTADKEQIIAEINAERILKHHTMMSSVAQLSARLTMCKTLSEYTAVLSEYYYLLHGAERLYLCLDRDWSGIAPIGTEYMCCEISDGIVPDAPAIFHKDMLPPPMSEEREKPMLFYFSPLHFHTRVFGYTVLSYPYPYGYDFSFRDWLKTAANTLEFLRMKNDIHYLTQCQRESSLYDSLTGFYNLSEFAQIVKLNGSRGRLAAVGLDLTADGAYLYGENYRSDIIAAAAKAIKQLCTSHEICCRTEMGFVVLHNGGELFGDKLKAMIHHALSGRYTEEQVVISYAEMPIEDETAALGKLLAAAGQAAEAAAADAEKRRSHPRFKQLLALRNEIMQKPHKAPDTDAASRRLCLSEGYFRAVYKSCFGESYMSDCINARIMLAKYLLSTSAMSVYAIAMKCGYTDEKYFARQFRQTVGCSPMQYRAN